MIIIMMMMIIIIFFFFKLQIYFYFLKQIQLFEKHSTVISAIGTAGQQIYEVIITGPPGKKTSEYVHID